MSNCDLARLVRWINPETGGWEMGRVVVLCNTGQVITKYRGIDGKYHLKEPILIQKTFGGLCFVADENLESIRDRSEWEKP